MTDSAMQTDPMTAREILPKAIDWLSATYPNSIIVPELSVADWGAARIDVAAITETHIVGVEIKGAGDSPARLGRQGLAYGMVAKEMWLLPCASIKTKCFKAKPSGWGELEVFNGVVRPWDIYERHREEDWCTGYKPSIASVYGHLTPRAMCGTLWKVELLAIARRNGIQGLKSRTECSKISREIENNLPAPKIHDEMIVELRARHWGGKKVLDFRELASKPEQIDMRLAQ